MSNTPKDMQAIKNDLRNIITPYINYLNLEGFIIIDADTKILKIKTDEYLVVKGLDAFYYNLLTSDVKLHTLKDMQVVQDVNAGIKNYGIIEDVWNKNFVRATDLNSLQHAQSNQTKVFIKDNDFQQNDIDDIMLANPKKVTQERANNEWYTLFEF